MLRLSPITKKRIKKFKKIKRAYYSLIILIFIVLISGIAEVMANKKPLILYYNNAYFFPVFKVNRGTDLGLSSILEPDYKDLVNQIDKKQHEGWYINPIIFWGSNESNPEVDYYPSPPSWDNWLGTDDRGRDILTRLVYGVRISLFFAVMNYLFALIIGVIVGGLQGFIGGWVDLLGQRLVEIWYALPYFFVLILLGTLLEPGLIVLTMMSAIFSWIMLSYYVRAEALRVRQEEYVLAATALGAGRIRNLFFHIIPNSLTPVITFTPFIMAQGVLTLSYLDFLGFGVQAPTASIGELIRQGKQNFDTAWWIVVFSVGILFFLILLLNFIGEGVRTAFDPRKVFVGSK